MKKITYSIREVVVYSREVYIDDDSDPESWVDLHAESHWVLHGDPKEDFARVENREAFL